MNLGYLSYGKFSLVIGKANKLWDVAAGLIIAEEAGASVKFNITDNITSLRVTYKGLLPNLFREGQGVVIEGILLETNFIQANTVFAKHDENYMPVSIKKELEKNEYWQKNYNDQ